MRTMKRKAVVAATGLVAAAGISLLGAGAASAADHAPSVAPADHDASVAKMTPRSGVMGDGSQQACQEYGNQMAQEGLLTGYNCTKLPNGQYSFSWY